MPIYLLGNEPLFPHPGEATEEGIIAAGGDLSPQRLLNAYASGIFPWYNEGEPILWWSPDPRLILFPGEIHVSRTMRRLLKKNVYRVTVDREFPRVINECAQLRDNQPGTWITGEMHDAYIKLHEMGFAHSVEVWRDKDLVGGLYGLSLGKCFFGESMFYTEANASKIGFITFVRQLDKLGFHFIDCQIPTPHLKSLGAWEIPRENFLKLLEKGTRFETMVGKWEFFNSLILQADEEGR